MLIAGQTYVHLIPGQDQEAVDRLAEALRAVEFTRSADGPADRGRA